MNKSNNECCEKLLSSLSAKEEGKAVIMLSLGCRLADCEKSIKRIKNTVRLAEQVNLQDSTSYSILTGFLDRCVQVFC